MTATTSPPPMQLALPGVELTPTGARLVGPVDRDGLAAGLVGLAGGVSTARWVVGDLFWAIVDADDGDAAPAAQLFATLGFEQAWLSTAIDVARAVPAEVRRLGLAWGHHDAVSHLSAEDQDRWLDDAEDEGWTVDELRHALKAADGAAQGRLEGSGGDGPVKVPKPPVATVRAILADDPAAWVLWQPATGKARRFEGGS